MKGIIEKVYGRYYTVTGEGTSLNCSLRGKLKRTEMSRNFSSPAAVGDVVDFEIADDQETGAVNEIFPRKNFFSRRDRVLAKDDIIAANLDAVVVVQSFDNPRLNLRYVDRLMVRAVSQHIDTMLCINKEDLAEKGDIDYVRSYYANTGFTLFFITASTGNGVEAVRQAIKGKRVLFAGSSGVGKTTLLNRLFPHKDFRTSEVSESTGKGKHTTTNVQLVRMDDGTEIIDTPGMREFGIADIEPQELSHFFPDFQEHISGCRFSPCFHDHEPQCGVINALEEGVIHEDRYVSYLNILDSLKYEWENRFRSS